MVVGARLLILLTTAPAALLLCAACGGGGSSSPAPGAGDFVAAAQTLDRLNYYRGLAGVGFVSLDPDLSDGAQKHANWLVLNSIQLATVGLAAHEEIPGTPGYTSEGYEAAHNSVIYQGVGHVEAVDNWFRTLYHRLGMLDPNLSEVGFGMAGDYVVLDIASGRVTGPLATPAAVVYPCPGQTVVPVDYKREIPHPIEGDDSLGIPITAEFFGPFGYVISDVSAQLVNLDNGANVDIYMQTPGNPFLRDWDMGQLVCIIPEDPLAKGSHYQVSMSGRADGSFYNYEWVFTTR
jgi:Cysteine-rich secretory protein family